MNMALNNNMQCVSVTKFLLLLMLSSLAWTNAWGAVGVVDGVEGTPHLLRKFKKMSLTKGLELELRDNIYTKTGSVILKMQDGSQINLGPDSHFKVKNYDTQGQSIDRDVLLFKGSSRFKVAKLDDQESFKVRSPVAVAGVRGTDFNMSIQDQGQTTVTVFSGLVACYSAQPDLNAAPSLVGAGFASSIAKNKAPQAPVKVSPKQLSQLKSATATSESAKEESSSDENTQDASDGGSDATDQGETGGAPEASENQPSQPAELPVDFDSIQGEILQNTIEQVQERVIEEVHQSSSIFDSIKPIAPPTTKE